MHWIARQFLDGYVRYPIRFNLKPIDTGYINPANNIDLEFKPGNSIQGTFINRGYFQQIEDYLAQYESQSLRDKLSAVSARLVTAFAALNNKTEIMANNVNTKIVAMDNNITSKISTLTNRVATTESRLSSYAPLSGANFSNPKAKESPTATDNSTKIATTEFVRKFVAQYPFPPKNVISKSTASGALKIIVKWSDHINFVYDNMTLSEWDGTRLVYRTDRYPTNTTDGTAVTTSIYRDQYKIYGFELTGITAERTIYMQLFPYSTKNIYNINTENRITGIANPEMQILDSLFSGRGELTGSTDGSGRALFGGGWHQTTGIVSNVVDIYNTLGAHSTTELSVGRLALASSTDGGGNVLFGGGYIQGIYDSSIVDKFNPNGVRSALDALFQPRAYLEASTDGAGNVLFGGGNADTIASNIVDKYDPNGNHTSLISLSAARYNLASSTDGNGNVLFGGGYGDSYSNIVDKYSQTGTKTTLTPLSIARNSLRSATDGAGNVLFAGGISSGNAYSNVVDKYSSTGIQSVLAPLANGKSLFTACSDGNGNVLFGGGTTSAGLDDVIERYSQTGIKTTSFILSTARSELTSAKDGLGNVLFAGGWELTPSYTTDRYTIKS